MTTPTREELEQAAVDTEEWLDELDPGAQPADPIPDLRAISQISQAIERDQARLVEAVTAARVAGRSWGMIARALGVTRQAAQQRYGAVSAAH
jgi:hypothetical protein